MKRHLSRIIGVSLLASTLLCGCKISSVEDEFVKINPGELPAKRDGVSYLPLERYDETVTLNVIGINYAATGDVPSHYGPTNNAFIDAAKTFLNIKLNVSVESAETYEEKLNLYIANDSLPDIFRVGDLTTLLRLKEGNMLHDLGDTFYYLNENYQNMYLSDMYNPALKAVMEDGKLYSFPNVLNPNEKAQRFYIRKDWLRALNLEVPTTYEGLVEVAKKFRDNAQKIVNDCSLSSSGLKASDIVPFGITKFLTAIGNNTASAFFALFGTRPDSFFEDGNGGLKDANTSEEMKAALNELKYLYSENLLPREFYNKLDANISNDIIAGKVGIVGGMRHISTYPLQESVSFSDTPTSEWVPVELDTRAGNKLQPIVDTVLFEDFNCVSSKCAHPEALARLTNLFYDMFYSDDAKTKYPGYTEPQDGFFYSWVPAKIWYTPYTIDSYKRVRDVFDELYEAGFRISDSKLSEMAVLGFDWQTYYNQMSSDPTYGETFNKLWIRERDNGFRYGYPYMQAVKAGKTHAQMTEFEKKGYGIYHQAICRTSGDAYVSDLSDGVKTGKKDKFYGFKTPAQQNYGEYLETALSKYMVKVITGQANTDSDWNNFVDDYNKNGGSSVISQINQWFKA